jgi:SAM-dependent methyltransferase
MANGVLIPESISKRAHARLHGADVVHAHFDQLGRTGSWENLYADIADPAVRWSFVRRQALLESLMSPHVSPETRVVEIGPGTGNLVGFFASRGCHYRAFDAAPAMVDATNVAIERHPGFAPGSRCERADIHALPVLDGDVDVVVAAGVVEYLDDPARAMRELARITREASARGGAAFITLPNRSSLNRIAMSRLGFLTNVASTLRGGRRNTAARPDVRRTAYTPRRFAADIAGGDWRLDRADYYDVEAMPYPLNRIAPRLAFTAKRQTESSPLLPKSLLANGMVLTLTRQASSSTSSKLSQVASCRPPASAEGSDGTPDLNE